MFYLAIKVRQVLPIVIEAVFFDLDGTLLHMNMDEFLSQYIKALSDSFREIMPPDLVKNSLRRAIIAALTDNNPGKTNQEVFIEHFLLGTNHSPQDLLPVFNSFYNNEYKDLRSFTQPTPSAKEVVDKLAGCGYRLVLATNPIFPRIAILERMKWAGVDSAPWEIITTYEEYHFCKPNPGFFAELLSNMGLSGAQALMVGNNTNEDLSASALGIKTYLAIDNLIDRGDSSYEPDFRGKLADLPSYLEQIQP